MRSTFHALHIFSTGTHGPFNLRLNSDKLNRHFYENIYFHSCRHLGIYRPNHNPTPKRDFDYISYTSVTRHLALGRSLYNSSLPDIPIPCQSLPSFPNSSEASLESSQQFLFYVVVHPSLVQPSSSSFSSYESTTENRMEF